MVERLDATTCKKEARGEHSKNTYTEKSHALRTSRVSSNDVHVTFFRRYDTE